MPEDDHVDPVLALQHALDESHIIEEKIDFLNNYNEVSSGKTDHVEVGVISTDLEHHIDSFLHAISRFRGHFGIEVHPGELLSSHQDRSVAKSIATLVDYAQRAKDGDKDHDQLLMIVRTHMKWALSTIDRAVKHTPINFREKVYDIFGTGSDNPDNPLDMGG